MKKLMMLVAAVGMMFGSAARAQDITGDWQGTLKAGKDLRIIMHIYKGDKDGFSAAMYSIDQTPQPIPATAVTRDGANVKITIAMLSGKYEGKLSENGKMMTGTWTQGLQPFPLELVKATPETAWEIPAPAAVDKPMAADADPSFDVATIKPNVSGGSRPQGIYPKGRHMMMVNCSLLDMVTFAYGRHVKQIAGAPQWASEDRFDIDAVPDQPGTPNLAQMRGIFRKLLEDRFKLTFHHEKREMVAYVLTVSKAGQKLTATASKGSLPGFGASPAEGGLALHLMNGTMTDFTDFLQMLVLDKPVVDQTSIAGRYDSNVTFTPDQTQFNGNPPKLPASDVPDAPDLFTAMDRQLGLKLAAEKTAVDVIVIDHVEKPSAN